MTNPSSNWRYFSGGRRESGRERRIRSSNQREDTAVHQQHNPLPAGRVVHATGWGETERIEGYAPEAAAPSNHRVDIMETDMNCDGGWDTYPVDKNVSADVTANPSDWSKPPQIQSVEHWDDTGAIDSLNSIIVGCSALNNPDLYLEKHIDWNWRIPAELLSYVDYGCAAPPRHGNPVVLGLESLGQNLQQGGGRGSFVSWGEKPQQGGGSLGSWGENPQQCGGSLGSWEEKPQQRGCRGSLGSWGENPQKGGGSLGSWG